MILRLRAKLAADFGGEYGEGGGDVEGVFRAEEGDFDDMVGTGESFFRKAVLFVAEEERKGFRKGKVIKRDSVLCGFNGN